ncbi:MAG TPA: OsmC family protein [Casimicrobiaceae bacterium]|nr:OsmC family protein [Casimicrobiaceae bacterium]
MSYGRGTSNIISCFGEQAMQISVTRDRTGKMRHVVRVRQHLLNVDEAESLGGEDTGPSPHDLYDAALGACKALTVLWYANRRRIPVEDIAVVIERDATDERTGTYRLHATLALTGPLSEDQRQELLGVAGKCPVHKLMTQVTTEISTELVAA